MAFIERHEMLSAKTRSIGVAVSGGADSVVMLHILHLLRSQFACQLHVLHVNHQLRGQASDSDEAFVRALANTLGMPLTVEHAAPPANQIEQRCRDLRRSFFARAVKENDLHAIALGHTRSDQAETVLFRLFRGAGITGLAGMRPVTSDGLIRPLLNCTREEVRAWATSQNIQWREDSSNLDTTFTRNRLRLETLPALVQTYNANLEALLAQSAELAQTEEDFWRHEIEARYAQLVSLSKRGLQINVARLAEEHLALRRRLIRHALSELRGNLRQIECEHVESILKLCDSLEGHDRAIVPGVDAMRSFDQLLLTNIDSRQTEQRDYQFELKFGQETELPCQTGFLSVQSLKSDSSENIYVNFKKELDEKVEICDWDGDLLAPGGTLPSLCVRNWRPGDAFKRAGHHSAEKIKTLFQSGKVLLWERKHWPVVVAGSEIVWVRRFGGAGNVTAAGGSRHIVRLIYRKA